MNTQATLPAIADVQKAISQLHIDVCRRGALNKLINHFSVICGTVRMSSESRRPFMKSLKRVCLLALN